MSAIYHQGRRYSLKSDADLAALLSAMQADVELQESVMRFEPSGSWCVPDGAGDYLRDAEGRYVTESLTDEDMKRYWCALNAVDAAAVQRFRDERLARFEVDQVRFNQAAPDSSGSTGQPWDQEAG